jgi:hypothetical protein
MTSDLMQFGEPEETHDDELHTYTWEDEDGPIARIIIDQVREQDRTTKGLVSVYWLGEGATELPVAGPIDVNLLTAVTMGNMNGVVKDAVEATHGDGWGPDWRDAMHRAKVSTLHHYQEGYPDKKLGQDPDREFSPPFLLDPYIARSGVTVYYGEGGLAKSTLALLFSISVAGNIPIFGDFPAFSGPVTYFDYEDDEEVHDARMIAMCRHLGVDPRTIPIIHSPLVAKVDRSLSVMKRKVRLHGSVMATLDSIGMGRGGDAASAEDTIRLFRGLRTLRMPVVAVDHMSREAKKGSNLDVDAFGSVYTMNSMRLGWALKRAEGLDNDVIYVSARNTKGNHSGVIKDRTFEIRYQSKNHIPTHISVAVSDGVQRIGKQKISVANRMAALLIGNEEGLPIQNIANELGLQNRGAVDNALSRDNKADPTFERMSTDPVSIRLIDWNVATTWSQGGETQ